MAYANLVGWAFEITDEIKQLIVKIIFIIAKVFKIYCFIIFCVAMILLSLITFTKYNPAGKW